MTIIAVNIIAMAFATGLIVLVLSTGMHLEYRRSANKQTKRFHPSTYSEKMELEAKRYEESIKSAR
ncbi:MAG: hypothetical protein M0Z45_07600 [Actinomycetota bacterium]|nr:hypothetical protein [Actinomycetota bacterium]MDA8278044.1 hypothetical protein [Actinomycetota bacterium]